MRAEDVGASGGGGQCGGWRKWGASRKMSNGVLNRGRLVYVAWRATLEIYPRA